MLVKCSSRNLQIPVLQYMMPRLGVFHMSTKTVGLKFTQKNETQVEYGLRYALFLHFTQRRIAVGCGRFRTTCRSHFEGQTINQVVRKKSYWSVCWSSWMVTLCLVLLNFFFFSSKFSLEWLIHQLCRKPKSDQRFLIILSWYIIDTQQRNPQLIWRSAATCTACCNLIGSHSKRAGFVNANFFSSMTTKFAIWVI